MRARSILTIAVADLAVLSLAMTVVLAGPSPAAERSGDQLLDDGPVAEPAAEWMDAQRVDTGSVSLEAARRARAQARAAREATATADPALASAPWEWHGPKNIGGRVLDIALDPDDLNTLYIATAGGGVWKSTDASITYTPAWPDDAPQSVGAIAATPDGTLFAGTGEPPPGGGSITYGGDGVYRSTDGGGTWTHVGLPDSGAIGDIDVVTDGDDEWIYVSATGSNFVPGGQRGLYRSGDRGDTWELVFASTPAEVATGMPDDPAGYDDTFGYPFEPSPAFHAERTGASTLAVDPQDADHLIVSMWERYRESDKRVYGGPGSGLFETRDGGDTWSRIDTVQGEDRPRTGRIAVTFAPSDPSRVYALVVDHIGPFSGFFRSEDGAGTWAEVDSGGITGSFATSQSSYGWWFGKLWVDPADPDRFFVGGVDLYESTDAGESLMPHSNTLAGVATGVAVVNPHADQHAMVWDERVPGRVYLANDGGMYRSDTDGAPGEWIGAASQGFTQHYSVDVSEQQPSRLVTGMQDNMCQRNYLAGDTGMPETWTKYGLCGDGLQTLIHPDDDRWVYGCAQYGGNCSRAEDGGGAFRFMNGLVGARHNWWMPIVFDPSNADVMYAGSNMLLRSTDAGLNFEPTNGQDLTGEPDQHDPSYDYGTITTVAVAPSNPDVIYVGTDNARVWRSDDAGDSFTRLDLGPGGTRSLPDQWVTRLAVDPDDARTVYVTLSGFRQGEDASHVFASTDGGATWDDVSGDLPNAPVNDVVLLESGDTVVVATDTGVYLSRDAASGGAATWLAVGEGMPMIPVLDLEHHAGTGTLTAATFGRGIMRVTLP